LVVCHAYAIAADGSQEGHMVSLLKHVQLGSASMGIIRTTWPPVWLHADSHLEVPRQHRGELAHG